MTIGFLLMEGEGAKLDATLMSVAAIHNLLPIFKSLSGDPREDFIANQQP